MAFRQVASDTSSPYLRFLLQLALTVLVIGTVMVGTGCESCCEGEPEPVTGSVHGLTQKWDGVYRIKVTGTTVVAPGGRVDRTLDLPQQAATASVQWTLPEGATNVQFPPGMQPEVVQVRGQDVYRFDGVPTDKPFVVSYTAGVDWTTWSRVYDAFRVDAGSTGSFVLVDAQVGDTLHHNLAEAPDPATGVVPLASTEAVGTTDDVTVWKMEQWFDTYGVTLTTSLCNDLVAALTSDAFFIASRVPVTPTTSGSIGYQLPLVVDDEHPLQAILVSYDPYGPVVTTTLAYRPERIGVLQEQLPEKQGQLWVALGAASDAAPSCPAGLEVPPDKWGFRADFTLDLHDLPDAGEGVVLPQYYCYEGQDSPLEQVTRYAMGRVARAIDAEMTAVSADGITCIGPKPLTIRTSNTGGPAFQGAVSAVITPTQKVSLYKTLWNEGSTPISATLSVTSSLGSDWRVYGGEWDGPDPALPLLAGSIIEVPAFDFTFLWFTTTVPSDIAAGVHALEITATTTTSPVLSAYGTVPLWVGEWVPPQAAPTPPPDNDNMVYLPMVLRGQ